MKSISMVLRRIGYVAKGHWYAACCGRISSSAFTPSISHPCHRCSVQVATLQYGHLAYTSFVIDICSVIRLQLARVEIDRVRRLRSQCGSCSPAVCTGSIKGNRTVIRLTVTPKFGIIIRLTSSGGEGVRRSRHDGIIHRNCTSMPHLW